MRLLFIKKEHQPSVFKCIRSDGTETWMKITQSFTIEHDLVHYAVETTLNFQQAFYGLLMAGYNITDFEAPRHLRLPALLPSNLPLEAQQAEILVNLFQTDLHNEGDIEDFISVARFTFQTQAVPFPSITNREVAQIRANIRILLRKWHELTAGETLELVFPAADSASFSHVTSQLRSSP